MVGRESLARGASKVTLPFASSETRRLRSCFILKAFSLFMYNMTNRLSDSIREKQYGFLSKFWIRFKLVLKLLPIKNISTTSSLSQWARNGKLDFIDLKVMKLILFYYSIFQIHWRPWFSIILSHLLTIVTGSHIRKFTSWCIWKSLTIFGQVRTNLDKFEQIWTS